jgi:hypothetical protein
MSTVVYAYVSLLKVTVLDVYILKLNGVILNVAIEIGVDATIGGIE